MRFLSFVVALLFTWSSSVAADTTEIGSGFQSINGVTPGGTGTITITAPDIPYAPFVPGNWSPVPTQVASALDQLAAGGSGITALTGDVTASGAGSVAATVALVGGSSAAAVHTAVLAVTAATNANTPSTVVKRDASGNFNGATIKAETAFKFADNTLQTTAATAPAIGGTITGGTVGSALFVGTGPVFAQDNANFFWDLTNHRLGLGITTPASLLDLGTSLANEKLLLYDGGVGVRYGFGIQTGQLRMFTPSGSGIRIGGWDGSTFVDGIGVSGTTGVATISKRLDFDNIFGTPYSYAYDGGAGSRIGTGLNGGEWQSFAFNGVHFSWNTGGDQQPSGTNELMRLDATTGNLGIGTTTPATKLEVKNAGSGNLIQLDPDSSPPKIHVLYAGNTGFDVTTAAIPSGSQVPTITETLQVLGSLYASNGGLISYATGSSPTDYGAGTITMWSPPGSPPFISFSERAVGFWGTLGFTSGTGDFQIHTGNQSFPSGPARLSILQSNGNVGIGTTTPGAKLEVAGSVILSTASTPVVINDTGGNGGNVLHAFSRVTGTAAPLSSTCSASCPAGAVATGGGCANSGAVGLTDFGNTADDTYSCTYLAATGTCTASANCTAY